LAPLAFDGQDAAAFLHGQLSTDVAAMPVGSVTWTSYNSAKGRMLASLLLWRRAETEFVALAAADLAEALRKRLAMFVLRARVSIRLDDRPLHGLAGPGARDALEDAFGSAPEPGHGAVFENADVIAAHDGRYFIRGAADRIRAQEISPDYFDWLGVRAGVALITRATQEMFVPQTLNFDLVRGIDFRKGCYPGQEIVARMQYLGRLKERLFAFHLEATPPAPGTPIVAGGETVGTVVNAAAAAGGGSDLLAVARFDAVERGNLEIGGKALTRVELPYAVPPPAAPTRVKL
jgi:folate-binding protein YgfZ